MERSGHFLKQVHLKIAFTCWKNAKSVYDNKKQQQRIHLSWKVLINICKVKVMSAIFQILLLKVVKGAMNLGKLPLHFIIILLVLVSQYFIIFACQWKYLWLSQ